MAAAGATLTGDKKLRRNLSKLAVKYPEAAGAALFLEASVIMAKSKPLVPVQFGLLRNSGGVSKPTMTASGPFVILFYGTKYGIFVHERTDIAHKVGQAKYLEEPFMAALPGMAQRLADRIKDNIEKGVRLS